MTYKVLSNLLHDGAEFKKGELIEMDEAVASPLVEDGVLSTEIETPKKAMTAEEKKAEKESKAEAEESKEETKEAVEEKPAEEKTDYNGMTVPELKKEADKRGLEVKTGAVKKDLVKLLEKNDESAADNL